MERENNLIFNGLNSAQKQAVENFKGASLIIAGAGSGKTKVLTNRIANILAHDFNPIEIIALTFTNKAAKEMKERIAAIVGWSKARYISMGTFHSVFLRFLKEHAELLGYPRNFTVYDSSNTRSAIRSCIKELGLDDKIYKPQEIQAKISIAKNNLYNATSYTSTNQFVQNDALARKPRIHEVFSLYEKRCKLAGAMDFDDILLNMNVLLRDFPAVNEELRERFKFVLVDEYQDTNYAQYLIVKRLASKHGNICVVGDDSQSIYAFRGAKIENILNFKKDYPNASQFKLEQNYRSTQTIVNAANSLIAKNKNQLQKECFSDSDQGEKINLIRAYSEQEESFLVAGEIIVKQNRFKIPFSSFAVLYRTNAQSRAIEEALRKRNIPYKIYGGHSFFDREEIKDSMALLRLVVNPKDNESFTRSVKSLSNGIGDTTISRIHSAALSNEISYFEAITTGELSTFGINSGIEAKLKNYTNLISEINSKVNTENAYSLSVEVLNRSGYLTQLKSDTSLEGQSRFENVEELLNSVKIYIEEREEEAADMENLTGESAGEVFVPLYEYLDNISLMSNIDEEGNDEKSTDHVKLMTIHTAKGLEFEHVCIIGLEENLFPNLNGFASESELEEERRLFYVAITRAKLTLSISYAQSRMKWGTHASNPPSRFLSEIDQQYFIRPLNFSAPIESDIQKRTFAETSAMRPTVPTNTTNVHIPSQGFTPSALSALKVGKRVEHDRFGYGKILEMEGVGDSAKAIVDFEINGKKTLLLKYAKLRVEEN